MDEEIKATLEAAAEELRSLRMQLQRANDRLWGIEVMTQTLRTLPHEDRQGYGVDVVWRIEKLLKDHNAPA